MEPCSWWALSPPAVKNDKGCTFSRIRLFFSHEPFSVLFEVFCTRQPAARFATRTTHAAATYAGPAAALARRHLTSSCRVVSL